MTNYEIKNFYASGDTSYGSTAENPYMGTKALLRASEMGMTTDPRTANQLSEISHKLNTGTSIIEMGTIGPQEFDTIPIQHFEEMKRKAKLADAELTMHAPIQGMDPSGFQERQWSEMQREQVERQLMQTMDKAALLVDTETGLNKNIPVTIHASNTFGSTWKPSKDGGVEYDKMIVVDRESGQIVQEAKREEKFYPGVGEEGKVKEAIFTPEKQLESINGTQWDDTINKVEFQRENADKILGKLHQIFESRYLDVISGKTDIAELSQGEYEKFKQVATATVHIQEADRDLRAVFSKAYKFAKQDHDEGQLKYLDELSKRYAQDLGYENNKPTLKSYSPTAQSEAIFKMTSALKQITPKLFTSIEEFSIDKAAQTFSNVALHSYEKHKENAPVVSMENLDMGRFGFTRAEEMNKLVEASRKKFVEQAKEKGMSEDKAKKAAEKMIGVTFDIGHLNISKKQGFKDEDLVKEAEAIKKYVNKVHLTDNFGNTDSHLPIGMGNVPVQELIKALGKEGQEAKKINEVGGWYQFFKTEPFNQLLEAAGSPIYSSGTGPYWNQTGGFQQSYMDGYGMMLPSRHYDMFQAGFSQLPQSLGGSVGQGNGQGRMGGGGF